MTRLKLSLLFFLVSPYLTFSQSAIIKNLYPTIKHNKRIDTTKLICFPVIYSSNGILNSPINNIIKGKVFGRLGYDTSKPLDKLLQEVYSKDKALIISANYKMIAFRVSRNSNSLLSIIIYIIPAKGDVSTPIYLNFDLTTGSLISLSTMLNTKNDSISMRQAIVPPFTDSVRFFELTLDKNSPKYSEIIQGLNNNLGNFSHNYIYQFILTEQELIVYFNCILPDKVLPYNHCYKVSFRYKTLKNVLKPELIKRLLN